MDYVVLWKGASHSKSTPRKSYQFLFKICNLAVMTCADLWPVFLTNRLEKAFQLQSQAGMSKPELQNRPLDIEVLSKW